MRIQRQMQPRAVAPALAVLLVSSIAAPAIAATILTFDIDGGVTNFQDVPPEYGDNVAGSPQAGHSYGTTNGEFTPNVVADYGAPGELPSLWTTGYGDLTNVYFNDDDSDTTLTLTLTAETGFLAVLLSFDISSFSTLGETIAGLTVRNGPGDTLYSQGSTMVPGSLSGGHSTIDFGTDGLEAKVLDLVIDLTGLGMVSDNIAIDNVAFAQVVPEPGTGLLLGSALVAVAAGQRIRRARRAQTRGGPLRMRLRV